MDSLVFTVLSYTGLRIGEMLALKWGDFNEKQKTIRVTKTLYNPNNHVEKYQLLTPKIKAPLKMTSRWSACLKSMGLNKVKLD